MTFADAERVLLALPRFTADGASALKPGLDRMRAMLAEIGNPHLAAPVVHVAGTNGKGSTASFAAALLAASGRRVGLHTSPHLWHVGERMRVDGVAADEDWLAAAVARRADLFARHAPSYYEATLLLAFERFADAAVDAMVVEVGLGGRLDATNVVAPAVTVVTALALDHTEILGPTLVHIAREKAGIVKPGAPFLTRNQDPDAAAVLAAAAERAGVPMEDVTDTVWVATGADGLESWMTPPTRAEAWAYDGVRIGLDGAHQRVNAALGLRAAETLLGRPLDPDAVRRGLADVAALTGLRGRLDTIRRSPRVVVDVSHNAHGIAAALAETEPGPGGRRTVALGMMADKDVDAVARLVAGSGARVVPVAIDGVPRALSPDALAALLAAAGANVAPPSTVGAVLDAFLATAAPDDVLLVAGSFLVVAQVPRAAFETAGDGPDGNPTRDRSA